MSSTVNNSIVSDIPIVVRSPERVDKTYATTEAQLEVWLSSQQSPEANCAYNEISTLEIRGQLDTARLRHAIDRVVSRHAALRSTLSPDGQQVIVHRNLAYEYKQLDFSQNTSQVESQLAAVIDNQARTPFDFVNGPLLRIVLQKISNTDHRLTVTAHHIVLDGWSLAVFVKDLGHFYDELSGIACTELPPANQYDQYAEAMKAYFASTDGQADENFWVRRFEDQIPVLDLPTQQSRPALRTYSGDRYDHYFSSELIEDLRKLGAKSGCSLFNVMLSAFTAFVSRLSGNHDLCIGIPTAGQAAMDHPELIGHCVNTLPFRTNVDGDLPFVDFMKACRSELLDAFDHQRYSYGTLLRKLAPPRDPSRPPMLSVSFNIDPMIDVGDSGFRELDVSVLVEPRCFENFEWFINGVIQSDKSVEMQIQYNSDLYSRQAIQFYFEGFETFLTDVASKPNSRIAELCMMSIPQRQQIIVDWNSTDMEYPVASTLHHEFSRQAGQTPDQTAVVFGDTRQTYAEIESQSNKIARYLQSQGIGNGDLVGVCVQRSDQMLVNLFGILKSGAGYVPLDPAYPTDRLQYMCDHSGLKLIVTQDSLLKRVDEFNKPAIALDAIAHEIQQLSSSPIDQPALPSDICYVIYTSGSTGEPKGVQVPHGTVVNFLFAMQKTPGFTADDSILAITTLSFDIAVLELFLPTISGGTVVILDGVTAADGNQLADQLEQHNISLMQATPATWRLMIQSGWNGKQDLKILCGGEPMPQDLVQPLLERCQQLWNMYGPTETTVWSAVYQITNATDPILIGKPIGNTQIYILDANGQEIPVGCEGEVFIGGAGVTCGYRNRQDLTDQRFVDNRYRNPFANFVSDKLYKTGDLAKFQFDGNIQFLRRNDKQVKVRGFRIELGEIENCIQSHPVVEQNVAVVREDTAGDVRLVAYVIAQTGQTVSPQELREHLRHSLPYYMVPQHIVQLDTMPQTNNGKIDYKALPAPTDEPVAPSADKEFPQPTTDAERYLASIWQQVLELDDIGLNDIFFDIGGHSLLVMKVISAVEQKTGVRLSPQEFLVSTLQQMAEKLDVQQDDSVQGQTSETAAPTNPNPQATPDSTANDNTASQTAPPKAGLLKTLRGFWD